MELETGEFVVCLWVRPTATLHASSNSSLQACSGSWDRKSNKSIASTSEALRLQKEISYLIDTALNNRRKLLARSQHLRKMCVKHKYKVNALEHCRATMAEGYAHVVGAMTSHTWNAEW